MKVKILRKAAYSVFVPGRAPGAKVLDVDKETDFPDAYAQGLIDLGLAELVKAEEPEGEDEGSEVDAEDAPVEEAEAEAEQPKTVVKKRSRSAKKEE